MGVLERLFRKRSPVVASQPDTTPPPVDRPLGTPSTGGTSGAFQAADTAQAERADAATAPEQLVKDSPPLSTLTRYQHDPAFNNFKKRLTRAPGTENRARGRNLDYPPPNETKR